MSVLQRWLNKVGVQEYLDLNEEERKTYMQMSNALAGRRVFDEEVVRFLNIEIDDTETKIIAIVPTDPALPFLQSKLDMCRKLRNIINAPKVEVQAVEAGIERMIESM